MSAPDLERKIKETLKELHHLQSRVLPIKVGNAAVDMFKDNIRNGGFFGRKYKEPLRRQLSLPDSQYGPLLSKNNHLVSSITKDVKPGEVIIRNPVLYALIHNEGGTIKVTAKMKGHFWNEYYKAIGRLSQTKKGKLRKNKRNREISSEALFFKAMALKKVGSKIKMPKRKFIGSHAKLTKMINETCNKELQKLINTWKNS